MDDGLLATVMQAANTLDLTVHPAGTGINQMWKQVCKDVVGTFPTQMLRASLVSDIMVRPYQHYPCLAGFAAGGSAFV